MLPKIPLAVAWRQPPAKVSSPAGGGWPPARWDPASADARGEQPGNALTPTCGSLPAAAAGPCRSRLPYPLVFGRNGLDFPARCSCFRADCRCRSRCTACFGRGEGWEESRLELPLDPLRREGDPAGSQPRGASQVRGKDKAVDRDLVLGWGRGAALPAGVAAVGDGSARCGSILALMRVFPSQVLPRCPAPG